MKTIDNNIEYTWTINNSRFITTIYKINSLDDVTKYLNEVKLKYPKATHYCYAYIFDSILKASDDGEPSGTAGFPILHVLEYQELNHILCIVTRYFGGIKLGAGGLVRAYTKSVTEALKLGTIVPYIKKEKLVITFDYSNKSQIDYLLKDVSILNQEFDSYITYTISIDLNKVDEIIKLLSPYLNNYQKTT